MNGERERERERAANKDDVVIVFDSGVVTYTDLISHRKELDVELESSLTLYFIYTVVDILELYNNFVTFFFSSPPRPLSFL